MIVFTTIPSGNADAKRLIAKWATTKDYNRAGLHRNEVRQHDYLLTRSGIRALLFQATGTNDWDIHSESNGKPYILDFGGKVGPHISLSHTKGLVACAISLDRPVGIDVEYWRIRDFTALAKYAFGLREQEEVARDGISAFYHIWTLKEAFAKTTGKGLSSILGKKDIFADIKRNGFVQTEAGQFHCTSPLLNYSLAIAATKQPLQLAIKFSEFSISCND